MKILDNLEQWKLSGKFNFGSYHSVTTLHYMNSNWTLSIFSECLNIQEINTWHKITGLIMTNQFYSKHVSVIWSALQQYDLYLQELNVKASEVFKIMNAFWIPVSFTFSMVPELCHFSWFTFSFSPTYHIIYVLHNLNTDGSSLPSSFNPCITEISFPCNLYGQWRWNGMGNFQHTTARA